MTNLKPITIAVIKDLQEEVSDLLICKCDIDVVWRLEKLHNMQQAFKLSAKRIRESI